MWGVLISAILNVVCKPHKSYYKGPGKRGRVLILQSLTCELRLIVPTDKNGGPKEKRNFRIGFITKLPQEWTRVRVSLPDSRQTLCQDCKNVPLQLKVYGVV